MTSPTRADGRPAPLSIRLSRTERRALEKLAGDRSLGSFIKERVFTDTPASQATKVSDRYEMLVRLLAALGESQVLANLDTIAKAAEAGDLDLSEEQKEQIGTACLLVLKMRDDLIRALGLKPPSHNAAKTRG